MEYNEEIQDQDLMDNDSESGGAKQWIQDNLRIIISVLVVVVIAAGIYSYSSRTDTQVSSENGNESSLLSEVTSNEEKATTNESQNATEEKEEQSSSEKKDQQITPSSASQETDNAFVETAVKGDGTTKLARRALANYLEKNPDSSLSAEHKIYIEDYLRKKSGHKGSVRVGTSVEFQKSLIQEAISKSKNLTDGQLKNLHKYALRVPSLT